MEHTNPLLSLFALALPVFLLKSGTSPPVSNNDIFILACRSQPYALCHLPPAQAHRHGPFHLLGMFSCLWHHVCPLAGVCKGKVSIKKWQCSKWRGVAALLILILTTTDVSENGVKLKSEDLSLTRAICASVLIHQLIQLAVQEVFLQMIEVTLSQQPDWLWWKTAWKAEGGDICSPQGLGFGYLVSLGMGLGIWLSVLWVFFFFF